MGHMNFKGSLGCSKHEMEEYKILRALMRAHSELTTVDLRRADLGLFRNLLSNVPRNKTLEGRGPQENLVNIQGSPLPSSGVMLHNKENSGRNARRPVWMNKELVEKL